MLKPPSVNLQGNLLDPQIKGTFTPHQSVSAGCFGDGTNPGVFPPYFNSERNNEIQVGVLFRDPVESKAAVINLISMHDGGTYRRYKDFDSAQLAQEAIALKLQLREWFSDINSLLEYSETQPSALNEVLAYLSVFQKSALESVSIMIFKPNQDSYYAAILRAACFNKRLKEVRGNFDFEIPIYFYDPTNELATDFPLVSKSAIESILSAPEAHNIRLLNQFITTGRLDVLPPDELADRLRRQIVLIGLGLNLLQEFEQYLGSGRQLSTNNFRVPVELRLSDRLNKMITYEGSGRFIRRELVLMMLCDSIMHNDTYLSQILDIIKANAHSSLYSYEALIIAEVIYAVLDAQKHGLRQDTIEMISSFAYLLPPIHAFELAERLTSLLTQDHRHLIVGPCVISLLDSFSKLLTPTRTVTQEIVTRLNSVMTKFIVKNGRGADYLFLRNKHFINCLNLSICSDLLQLSRYHPEHSLDQEVTNILLERKYSVAPQLVVLAMKWDLSDLKEISIATKIHDFQCREIEEIFTALISRTEKRRHQFIKEYISHYHRFLPLELLQRLASEPITHPRNQELLMECIQLRDKPVGSPLQTQSMFAAGLPMSSPPKDDKQETTSCKPCL